MRRALALAGLLGMGCSLAYPPSDHRAEPVRSDGFCAVYADVFCDGVIGCCPAAAEMSLEVCRASLATSCASVLAPYLGDSRTGYDPEEAGHQLAVARELVGACDPSIASWQHGYDGFWSILQGTTPEGELCNATFVEMWDTGRVDVARFYSCAGDLACRPTTSLTEWRCLARAGAESICTGFADCEEGLACIRAADGRTCRPRLAAGATCEADAQCESYDCGCPGGVCTCGAADAPAQVYCGLFR